MTISSSAIVLKQGSQGPDVKRLQVSLNTWLNPIQHDWALAEDGIFGIATERMVKFFQCHHFLEIDGIVGNTTRTCLEGGVAVLPTLKYGSTGAVVLRLQTVLSNYSIDPGPLDGIYGVKTRAAVMRFQNDHHIYDHRGNATGEVGPSTWTKLAQEPAYMTCWTLGSRRTVA